MSKNNLRLIVLTGPPGCGKTSLVKNVCDVLRKKNFTLNGFFTEEIRMGRERVGFDVVLMNGKRAPLARVKTGNCSKPGVGKYAVDVNSFEACVLPLINSEDETSVVILDEIGKMEMLSEKFKFEVNKCINSQNGVILATVPFSTPKPIPLVEKIKAHPNTCLITVDKNNRDFLINEIINLIIKTKEDISNSI